MEARSGRAGPVVRSQFLKILLTHHSSLQSSIHIHILFVFCSRSKTSLDDPKAHSTLRREEMTNQSNHRYEALIATFGEVHFEMVKTSCVLVVGAGGIGCEILKNLVLSGFLNIEVIDLDTIDISNLNRQFLFRTEHVGHSKAVVAAAAAMRFNPDATVIAHYGNIKDQQFGISYISKFNVVLNALDNIDARRHVNRLCLAAKVPLIDSGTTGYLGQVMPIFKDKTACYECTPKPTQKVYPICTIRSTPDKPVHCIVWAKECFKLIFGNTTESMLFEDPTSGEQSTYMHLVQYPSHSNRLNPQDVITFGITLLLALYNTEVLKRIDMGIYKTAKSIPLPIAESVINEGGARALSLWTSDTIDKILRPSKKSDWDRTIWTEEECVVEFLLCMCEAINLTTTDSNTDDSKTVSGILEKSDIGKMVFDKDDVLAMRFVCAASNLRSSVFSIPKQSFHDAKGIAGKISTTPCYIIRIEF